MKREFLEGFNLDKEIIDKILGENGRDIEGLKQDIETQKTTIGTLTNDLDTVNAKLEGYDPNWKETAEKAQKALEGQIKSLKLDFAVEKALMSANARNVKAAKALIDTNKIEFDGETLKGLDDQVKSLLESEESKFLFQQEETKPQFKGFIPGEKGDGTLGAKMQPHSLDEAVEMHFQNIK